MSIEKNDIEKIWDGDIDCFEALEIPIANYSENVYFEYSSEFTGHVGAIQHGVSPELEQALHHRNILIAQQNT